jgi:hypothetical protein
VTAAHVLDAIRVCIICRRPEQACTCMPRPDDALLADALTWMLGDALPRIAGTPGGADAHATGMRIVERMRAAGVAPSAGQARVVVTE